MVSTTAGGDRGTAAAYGSIHVYEVAPNRYDVYGTRRPGAAPARGRRLGAGRSVDARARSRVTTPLDQTAAPGDVLGLCQPNGSVVHYRGVAHGRPRTAAAPTAPSTSVLVENYLRGVLSREVSTSWGNAGGGAGMNALWAMAVAARSFALSQNRYPLRRDV